MAREQSADAPHVQLTWRERLPDASDDIIAEPEINVTVERPDCASFKMVGTRRLSCALPCKPRRPKPKGPAQDGLGPQIPGKRAFVFSDGHGHDLFFW